MDGCAIAIGSISFASLGSCAIVVGVYGAGGVDGPGDTGLGVVLVGI